MNVCNYSHLISDKDAKNAEWIPDNGCLEIWMFTCGITKLDPYLLTCTKINSKCNKDITMKRELLNLLEEMIGSII